MAGEENLFLVLEVVVEIALLHVERRGDLLDGRAVIAEAAERRGGALQDVDARRGVRIGVARPRVRRRVARAAELPRRPPRARLTRRVPIALK